MLMENVVLFTLYSQIKMQDHHFRHSQTNLWTIHVTDTQILLRRKS